MSLAKVKLVGLVLASFLPVLLALFVSVNTSQAVTPPKNVSLLCLHKDTSGQFTQTSVAEWPGTDGKCPNNTTGVTPTSLPSDFKALCALVVNSTSAFAIYNGVNAAGKTSCDAYSDASKYSSVKLILRTAVLGKDPFPPTVPPASAPGPGTAKPPVKSSPSGTPTSTINSIGGCPDGFTSKGPLCIPNNPFGSSEGIAGKGTVGELATTIISILLGLSGIVAVIMIIIGGYHVMTARGNETQLTNGRKTLINALIGLAIIIVSYAVVQAITNYLTNKN